MKAALLIALALLGSLVWAVDEPECSPATLDKGGCLEITPEDVVSVYDGDTFTVRVASWPPLLSPISIRAAGYDTPELRGQCRAEQRKAYEARDALRRMLGSAHVIRLEGIERGKYFRLVAGVRVDGWPVSLTLISAGLARPYDGGARAGWCDE